MTSRLFLVLPSGQEQAGGSSRDSGTRVPASIEPGDELPEPMPPEGGLHLEVSMNPATLDAQGSATRTGPPGAPRRSGSGRRMPTTNSRCLPTRPRICCGVYRRLADLCPLAFFMWATTSGGRRTSVRSMDTVRSTSASRRSTTKPSGAGEQATVLARVDVGAAGPGAFDGEADEEVTLESRSSRPGWPSMGSASSRSSRAGSAVRRISAIQPHLSRRRRPCLSRTVTMSAAVQRRLCSSLRARVHSGPALTLKA